MSNLSSRFHYSLLTQTFFFWLAAKGSKVRRVEEEISWVSSDWDGTWPSLAHFKLKVQFLLALRCRMLLKCTNPCSGKTSGADVNAPVTLQTAATFQTFSKDPKGSRVNGNHEKLLCKLGFRTSRVIVSMVSNPTLSAHTVTITSVWRRLPF